MLDRTRFWLVNVVCTYILVACIGRKRGEKWAGVGVGKGSYNGAVDSKKARQEASKDGVSQLPDSPENKPCS